MPPTLPSDLPKTWHVSRMKHWVSINEKTLPEDTDPNQRFDYIEIGAVANGSLIEQPKAITFENAPSRARRIVRPGDTIVSTVRAYLKAVWYAEHAANLVCSTGFAVLTPKPDTVPKYVSYVARSEPFIQRLNANSVGTNYPAVPEIKFADTAIPVPPLDEQAAIVRYLDRADELINRYISSKERLIALLEEQRQAVIHQAVTRGLTPEVRFESSGIEWLEDIPEHWEPRSLKTICRMKSGDGITAESIEEQGDYPVYGGNGVRGFARNYTHDGEFVLIGRQGALCGNIHVARGRFWASEHAVVASLVPSHDLNWFAGLLASMNLNQYSIAAAQPGLSVERVMNLRVPVPPVAEQATIGKHIINTARDTDVATTRIARQIDLMNEYRTRLIADVVTGQLDVRHSHIGPDTQ